MTSRDILTQVYPVKVKTPNIGQVSMLCCLILYDHTGAGEYKVVTHNYTLTILMSSAAAVAVC